MLCIIHVKKASTSWRSYKVLISITFFIFNSFYSHTCCNGMIACSGYCCEQQCPEFCLALEVLTKNQSI